MTRDEVEVQDRVAHLYEECRYEKPYARAYHDWWNRKLLSMVDCTGNVLDAGCGTGILGDILAGKASSHVGMDISHVALRDFAKARIHLLTRGDAQQLPYGDGSFDTVVGRSLLHHLPDPQRAIDEIARVLKPGGELVVVDTNRSILTALPRWVANHGEHFSDDHQNMSYSDLSAMVATRFEIKTVYFFGFFAYPIGFPDILDIGRFLPMATTVTRLLIGLDAVLSRIPFVRRLAWGVMIMGRKKG